MKTVHIDLKQKGFTLIETVILIILFVILGYILTNLFIGQNSLYRYYDAEVKSGGSARLALDRIVSLARQADSVLSTQNFSSTDYFSDNDTLILRMQSIDISDEFIVGAYDYVVYYLDPSTPNILREVVDANVSSKRQSVSRILSESVDSVEYVYDTASFTTVSEVEIEIVAAESFSNSVATTTLNSLVKLRNH